MPRARKIPRSEWERNKQSICALFIDRDKSHEELVLSMAEEHGFHASKAQYVRQLGEWNIKKYSTKKDWKHADALVRKRKIDGKETEILMNGKLISAKKLKKELGRYGWQQTYDQSFTEDAPGGVIARTPPSSMPTSIRVRALPWFQFRDELHLLAFRNSPAALEQGLPRHSLSASGTQVTLVPFVNEVLITRPLAKTTSDAVSLMQEQIPAMPELDPATQVVHRDPDPWSLALQWAVYRCTNNLLRPNQVDQLLRFASATGNLAVLKGICRMRGPTTMALLSRLLPSAVRLRDSALAEFFLHQGADPEARDGTYWDWTSLQIAAEDHNGDIVQLLLEHGADPNHVTNLNQTPLQLALRKPGELSLVKALVQAGGDLDLRDEWIKSPLMVAVANHDLEAVRFLIEAGADLNFCSFTDGSVLQIAVEAKDVEMVKFLLESGANPNIGTNSHTSLPLQIENATTTLRLPLTAAVCKDTMMLQCLTHAGLDTGKFRWSQILQLFHFSSTTVLRGYLKRKRRVKNILTQPTQFQWQRSDLRERQIIDLLLQAGADVNATPPSAPWGCAETPLQAAARSGDIDICSLFIYHGGNIHAPAVGRGGMTCLQAASMSGHFDLVYNLLSMGADVNALASSDGWTALQAATFSGSMETVDLLLAWGSNVNHQSPSTALEIAIEQGHDALVNKLLYAGADINQCGTLGSALFNACRNRNLHLFDLLLALGAHPDPPACHVSPLMAAIEQEWQYGAQVLIQAGADVNKPCIKPSSSDVYNDWGWDWDLNVPLVAAVLTDEVEFVQMLFDAGAQLNAQTSRCLGFAVQHRSNDIVRLLLEKGANPNQVCLGRKATTTPIHMAVMRDDYDLDTEVLKTLIEFGADVNASSGEGYPLEIISSEIMALGEGGFKDYDLEEARDLLLQAHANPGLFNQSKLQRAAEKGDISQVRSLIASGENVNEPANDNGGATALQHAAMHGHLGIAILLIENGAHINAPGAKHNGRTALQGAAENGRLDMVHLLLEHDDEPELLEERRRDAAGFADRLGHSLIRDILEGCNDRESCCELAA
ncbi:hypothetical protein BHE90_001465 [Fusarium euwallaceae]|uniref:Clr5 domain-containing protein n=1 Tax=Fusarium euwallaceae TaxID=1147111 RepID=A0A430M7T5_9HYPO|nr:hypothetical protein BHE90_001465 [Fusarium euwallaceae]